jgi:nucleoside-diphosphate-sugar epimerase
MVYGMRVLITGGTGRLGPFVCKAFLSAGFDVRLLLHRRKARGLGKNLEIVNGNITHPEAVKAALDGIDAVVHLAGIVQPLTEEKPELAQRINVDGTRMIVSLVKESGRRIPFVYPSSVAVFGPRPDLTDCIHNNKVPCNPTSVYAKTKIQSENIIKESGIDYVILRLTAVPYLRLTLSDAKAQMYTIPLKNRLEFCHPDDVALAMVNAVKSFQLVKGKTLIIAGGPSQQMLYEDMLRAIFRTFGLPLPPQHKFASEPFPLHWYDTSTSQELLKFQRRTLEDYSEDFARQFPAPFLAIMRHFIGPAFGSFIVRML